MVLETIGTIAALIAAVIVISSAIRAAVKKIVKYKATRKKKHFKTERNAVPIPGIPIVKSPKGYVYYPDQDPKKRAPHCGNCHPPKLVPLDMTGGLLSREMVCPVARPYIASKGRKNNVDG